MTQAEQQSLVAIRDYALATYKDPGSGEVAREAAYLAYWAAIYALGGESAAVTPPDPKVIEKL